MPPDSPVLTPHIPDPENPDPGPFLFIDRSPPREALGDPGVGGRGGGRSVSLQALVSYPHVAFTVSFRTWAAHLFLKPSQLPLKHILRNPL